MDDLKDGHDEYFLQHSVSIIVSFTINNIRVTEGRGSQYNLRAKSVYNKSGHFPHTDRLVGQLVKASASRAEDRGFESRLRRDFSEVESYQ